MQAHGQRLDARPALHPFSEKECEREFNRAMATAGRTTRVLAGVTVPDTPLVRRAIEFVRVHSEPYMFNHVMRSWLFAEAIAQRDQRSYDSEVLAVSTLLHDLGLSEAFYGPLRFEVEGANAARAFARNEGVDEHRTQLIWDGVALNSTPSIALHKEAEVALCTAGIGLDWGGWGYDGLPQAADSRNPRGIPSTRDEAAIRESHLLHCRNAPGNNVRQLRTRLR